MAVFKCLVYFSALLVFFLVAAAAAAAKEEGSETTPGRPTAFSDEEGPARPTAFSDEEDRAAFENDFPVYHRNVRSNTPSRAVKGAVMKASSRASVSTGSDRKTCESKCYKWSDWCIHKSGYHNYGDCVRCVVACNRARLQGGSSWFTAKAARCSLQHWTLPTASWTDLAQTSAGKYDTCA